MNDENFGYQSRSRPVAALARTNNTVSGDRERYRFARSPSGVAQCPIFERISVGVTVGTVVTVVHDRKVAAF